MDEDEDLRPPLTGGLAAFSASKGLGGELWAGRLREGGGLTTTCPKKDTSFGERVTFEADPLREFLPPEAGLFMSDVFPLLLVLFSADRQERDLLDRLMETGVSNTSLPPPPALVLFVLLDGGEVSESSTGSDTFPCCAPVEGDTLLDPVEFLLPRSRGDSSDMTDAFLLRFRAVLGAERFSALSHLSDTTLLVSAAALCQSILTPSSCWMMLLASSMMAVAASSSVTPLRPASQTQRALRRCSMSQSDSPSCFLLLATGKNKDVSKVQQHSQ